MAETDCVKTDCTEKNGIRNYNNFLKFKTNAFEGADISLVLNTVFGFKTFRPLQKEIIESILLHHDTMAIMSTGGGKSLCYQLPALILPGITIVISPLISLMQDQVQALDSLGIAASFLNSSLTRTEFQRTVQNIRKGNVKIIYVSPEGLATGRIREIFAEESIQVSLITVDEAHCVSEWGHDFRPDYLDIIFFRRLFSDAVMLALTATATTFVQKEIIKNLGLKKPEIFMSSFDRPNIYLAVKQKKHAIEQVAECVEKHRNESGIVYCFSRKQAEELTKKLQEMNYSAVCYHAGLEPEERKKHQQMFINNQVKIIVATVAFGMGIDKSDVRFVINYDMPKSLEEYYQEIGRAGRDGLPSEAILLYSPRDRYKIRHLFDENTDVIKAESLLQKMENFATSPTCRRKILLSYFGETKFIQKKTGKCCDVCSINAKI